MKTLLIAGAGAAGIFCAARLADEKNLEILILEKSSSALKKVLASGGGRCNFTNINIDKFQPKNFYPRGASKLRKAFKNFGAESCRLWFKEIGVESKVEENGRVFPVSDRSESIAQALLNKASAAKILYNCKVCAIERNAEKYKVSTQISGKEKDFDADFILISCGGKWDLDLQKSLEKLGHKFYPPAPSLFALEFEEAKKSGWGNLAGIAIDNVKLSLPQENFNDAKDAAEIGKEVKSEGAFLFTHSGASGPSVLELSSRAARLLQSKNYHATLYADFFPSENDEQKRIRINSVRQSSAKNKIKNSNPFPFPNRFWQEYILPEAQIDGEKTWANFSKEDERKLFRQVSSAKFICTAKATHKGEFVTCGGLDTEECDFSKMESKFSPNLFFAGECLDIDAITGGYNLQAAWTCAKICSDAIIEKLKG